MGYSLQAFIAKGSILQTLHQHYSLAKIVTLNQGISMIPLTSELFYQIHGINEPEWILPDEGVIKIIEQQILEVIGKNKIAYIEAGYFGGEGGQIAIIWENGYRHKEFGYGKDSINQALQEFGVQVQKGIDEFETLGLGNQKNTKDW